jgi:hypothetical protein
VVYHPLNSYTSLGIPPKNYSNRIHWCPVLVFDANRNPFTESFTPFLHTQAIFEEPQRQYSLLIYFREVSTREMKDGQNEMINGLFGRIIADNWLGASFMSLGYPTAIIFCLH